MKKTIIILAAMLFAGLASSDGFSQRKTKAMPRVCGNPDAACKGRESFQPYELPVVWPPNSVIAESAPFYAIILKSAKFDYSSDADCDKVYTEDERREIQLQFPTNKVFALKCVEPGMNYYTGVSGNVVFIAVFAGNTLAEANKFLKTVQATGQFPGVRLRKMRAGTNGT